MSKGKWAVPIAKIGTGEIFTFYLWNVTGEFVQVYVPDHALYRQGAALNPVFRLPVITPHYADGAYTVLDPGAKPEATQLGK